MCVLFLAIDRHPRWRVVLAANRDEHYARKTAPAGLWRDAGGSHRGIIGGRDLEAGGTWLGVTEDARWAALTNVRDLPSHGENRRSRGDLPAAFLREGASPEAFAREAFRQREAFNPFNLLTGAGAEVWYASTHTAAPERVPPGVHGLSNATLNTPWPKVTRGKAQLERLLHSADLTPDALFALLEDAEPAPDADLPETGVGLEWERILSPIYIASPDYGTRASTVLLLDRDGAGHFVERTTAPEASGVRERAFTIGGGAL
ncbi:NRDE family protein [Rubricoccus marinus]|uniref:NRDE family protein n=1 Tax=Rubricoccus marinus TaxID=716817 RepID=A0A259TXR6_9BACT|nr:NRDE family protein [Rubricoccus marinus]OZC02486.1 hypothetical protein BSZ36_05535 [Rubricoccus marinus]